jgi:hypothetical protein
MASEVQYETITITEKQLYAALNSVCFHTLVINKNQRVQLFCFYNVLVSLRRLPCRAVNFPLPRQSPLP